MDASDEIDEVDNKILNILIRDARARLKAFAEYQKTQGILLL